MFWGLIMEPQKRYSQVIKKAFHISMASLDVSNSDDQPAQILCGYEGKNYLLCTLQKPDKLQCNLDLYFEEGRSVSFASNGKSLIHLTGYLTKDMLEESSEESEEESFEVQTKKKSRKDDGSLKQPTTKKLKLDHLFADVNEEDESDDSDFNIEKILEEESGEDSEEEDIENIDMDDVEDESLSEDDDDDEEDEEDDDEEEDEDEESDDEDVEEEEKVAQAAVQNGLSKKSKKNKKAEEPSTPTKKNKQAKEKVQLTPGPNLKQKKQDKSASENNSEKKGKGKEEKKSQQNQAQAQKKKTLSGGIIIEDLKLGHGDPATNGKFIHVYYEGRLQNNNKVFDKSLNGPGFGFRLGKGEVIKGWDIGVNGMKVGGKRRIICPPHVAYGAKGSPPVIPPNSTLVFEVELRKVK